MNIVDVALRRIIDSRGNPTVEADIRTEGGFGRAAAPAGASTGTHEAMAWPEGSVSKGIRYTEKEVMPKLVGQSVENQANFDKLLKDIMVGIHSACVEHGSQSDFINYVDGANIGGFIRVADSMIDQGIV